MINIKNKRGQQEGIGLGTLLVLIIGLIAVIVIIIGITTGFDQFFGAIGLLPDDLTKLTAACKTYSETEALRPSYCQFNEGRVEGKKGWYNCVEVHRALTRSVGEGRVDFPLLDCASDAEKNKCQSLKSEKGDLYKGTEIVNGRNCMEWGVPK